MLKLATSACDVDADDGAILIPYSTEQDRHSQLV